MKTTRWLKGLLLLLAGSLLVAPAGLWLSSGSSSQPSAELLVCPQGCAFTSIQAAIEAAPAGGTVRVLPGLYQENLVITKEIRLIADGPEFVTLHGLPEVGPPQPPYGSRPVQVPLIRIEEATNVLIEGFTLLGSRALGNRGIAVRNGASATIRANRMQDFWIGIALEDDLSDRVPPRALILGNTIIQVQNDGWGISIYGGQAVIEGNRLEDNSMGIFVEGASCCEFSATVSLVFISSNTIRGGREGVNLSSGFAQASLIRNRISGARNAGVALSNHPLHHVILFENEIVDNQGWGMALQDVICRDLTRTYSIGSIHVFAVVEGGANKIRGNQAGDLCPSDWPLPLAFKKL
jgi:nitrous oxidase accessory protein NosD